MGVLTSKDRKGLDNSDFGLPAERKYPMPDKSHAINAEARAKQQYDKGNLSSEDLKQIDNKAHEILGNGKDKK